MAFPSSPTNGQRFNGFKYNSTTSGWESDDLVFNSNGDVLIGTTTTGGGFESSQESLIKFKGSHPSNDPAGINIESKNGLTAIEVATSGVSSSQYSNAILYKGGGLEFNDITNSKVRMNITSSGEILVNTTNPRGFNLTVESGVKSSAGLPLSLSSNDTQSFDLLFNRSAAGTGAYYSLNSVEQGVAYRNLSFQPNGGKVLIRTTTENGSGAVLQSAGGISAGQYAGGGTYMPYYVNIDIPFEFQDPGFVYILLYRNPYDGTSGLSNFKACQGEFRLKRGGPGAGLNNHFIVVNSATAYSQNYIGSETTGMGYSWSPVLVTHGGEKWIALKSSSTMPALEGASFTGYASDIPKIAVGTNISNETEAYINHNKAIYSNSVVARQGIGAGEESPVIKYKKLTGTTSNTQGGFVSISHGLNVSKILSVSISCLVDSSDFIPENYSTSTGRQFSSITNSSYITIYNISGNSGNILSKPLSILITYEA